MATSTESAVKAASDTAGLAVKAAIELKARLDKAVATPEAVKAAAEALVDSRWVDTTDVEKVAKAVSDPTAALTLLAQIAQKSAEKIAQLTSTQSNQRLDAGTVLDGNKKASAPPAPPVDVAAQIWNEKMANYRKQMGM